MRFITWTLAILVIGAVMSSCLKATKEYANTIKSSTRTSSGLQGAVLIGEGLFNREIVEGSQEWGVGLVRVDWDNDGIDDILALTSDGILSPVTVSMLAPDLSATSLFTIYEGHYSGPPTAADMDADGFPELCIGMHIAESTSSLPILGVGAIRRGGEELFSLELGSVDPRYEVCLADLKGDGRGLLLLSNGYENRLSAFNLKGEMVLEYEDAYPGPHSLAACDLNNDGILEVVSVADQWLVVRGSDLTVKDKIRMPRLGMYMLPVDHDGDGQCDLLLESGTLISGSGDIIYSHDFMPWGTGNHCAAAVADIASPAGLETALMLYETDYQDRIIVMSQKGKVLYDEIFTEYLAGIVSTHGMPDWPPGFLVQLKDAGMVLYTTASSEDKNVRSK